MTVSIYNTDTDADHIYKDISNVVGTWSGAVRGEVDVHEPDILINGTVTSGNYAYVDTFGRYYWIREKTVVREGLTLVRLTSDPLMSFADSIMQLSAYVTRASVDYNMDMVDRMTPCVAYDRGQVLAPRGVGGVVTFNASDSSVYLQCIGGE